VPGGSETHPPVPWVQRATELFRAPRPQHFTDPGHCCECAEHDATLLAADLDTIGMEQLGNPGWDPICFTSAEGKKYWLPALVRLTLATIEGDFYLDQLLFHLEGDGPDNEFVASCSAPQRAFVADFIGYLVDNYPEQIEAACCTDRAQRTYRIWSDE
jgi:hypothetical protein